LLAFNVKGVQQARLAAVAAKAATWLFVMGDDLCSEDVIAQLQAQLQLQALY
jgi:hypothetical protein